LGKIITCIGCGSKWELPETDNEVRARLVECPLCEQTKGKKEK